MDSKELLNAIKKKQEDYKNKQYQAWKLSQPATLGDLQELENRLLALIQTPPVANKQEDTPSDEK